MNIPRTILPAAGLLALFFLAPGTGIGQTATTNPVGYLQVSCLSNSDTLVAIPFSRPAAFTGAATVSSTSPNTLTFSSSPGFTTGQFVFNPGATPAVTDHFYLTIGPANAALTGTLSVMQNSATVAGTGTSFGTQVVVGDRLAINDGTNVINFTVTAIASTTSLTLDRPFVDSAATGSSTNSKPAPTVLPRHNALTTLAATPKVVQPKTAAMSGTLTGLAATFDHSPSEGRWYMVTANDTGTVTVNLNGDSLSSVAAGTQVSVVPCWTLDTLFPAANAGTAFTPTTSTHALNTQILVPDYMASGYNNPPAVTYFYLSTSGNTGWRSFNDSNSADHGSDYFLPDGNFTVRQTNNSPNVTMTFNGTVPMNKIATTLMTSATQPQDNPVGLNRPSAVTLNSLGLNPMDGSFQATTSTHNLLDQLFVYDNSQVLINKPASATYFYINNTINGVANVGWRSFNDSNTADHGNDLITAGSALTIRKAPTSSGQSVVWSNTANY